MIHEEEFVTDKRGVKIFRQWWLPDGQPKALVILCHGLNEHSGRYAYFAESLVKSGYAVYTLDHVAHGKTEGKRHYVEGWDHWVENVITLTKDTKKKHPGLPVVLFGHSLGAAIAVHVAADDPSRFCCFVLSGPNVGPVGISRIEHAAVHVFSKLLPSLPVAAIDNNLVCTKKEVVDALNNDPLATRGKMPALLCYQCLDINTQACKKETVDKLTLPIYIAHGSDDKICLLEGAQAWIKTIPHENKELKVWDKAYHEILNEDVKDEVIAGMVAFMDKNLNTTAPPASS